MQLLDDALAMLAEYLPAPQSMQSDSAGLPTVDEYLPTTQAMQSSVDSVPNRPGEQGVHVEAPAACRVSVIDPGGQSTQSTVEFPLNLPAAHARHDEAPAASNVSVTAPGSHVMQSETLSLPRLVSTLSVASLTTYKQLPLELLNPLADRHVLHSPDPSHDWS